MRKARITERRIEILKLIAKGFNNQIIAKEMKLSLSNTRFQKYRLYCFLGVHNAKDAVIVAKSMKIIY